jgi:hypothetical protein
MLTSFLSIYQANIELQAMALGALLNSFWVEGRAHGAACRVYAPLALLLSMLIHLSLEISYEVVL